MNWWISVLELAGFSRWVVLNHFQVLSLFFLFLVASLPFHPLLPINHPGVLHIQTHPHTYTLTHSTHIQRVRYNHSNGCEKRPSLTNCRPQLAGEKGHVVTTDRSRDLPWVKACYFLTDRRECVNVLPPKIHQHSHKKIIQLKLIELRSSVIDLTAD